MTEPTPTPPTIEVLHRDTGDVVVGQLPAAPAGAVTVALPGATAYVDPTAVDLPPAVVVVDEQEAAPVLDRLFGQAVAAQVLTPTATPVAVAVDVVDTDAARRLVRHAVLRWLWTTGPLPLDRATLAYEAAVVTDDVADLLDPGHAPDVAGLAPLAVALARTLRARGDTAAWPGLSGLLEDSLDAVLRRLPLDDAARPPVEHEAELRRATAALDGGPLDWDRWAELLAATRPEAAAHAGDAGPAVTTRGRTSVDWARVPPGLLDTAEGTVTWRAEPADGERLRIDVEVTARPAPPGGGLPGLVAGDPQASEVLARLTRHPGLPLGFRVYGSGFGLPLAHAHLSSGGDGLPWHGSAHLPVRAVADRRIVVDVHRSGWRPAPRQGPAADAAEAMRWAARGTALLRLALAAGEALPDGVREPWERARQLYAAVAAGDGPDAGLARRQAARCDAVLVAYLEASGGHRTVRMRNRLAAADVPPADLVIPDLRGPGWAPSVTELGMLAASGRA